jgi:hypothetical protein
MGSFGNSIGRCRKLKDAARQQSNYWPSVQLDYVDGARSPKHQQSENQSQDERLSTALSCSACFNYPAAAASAVAAAHRRSFWRFVCGGVLPFDGQRQIASI